MKRDLLAMKVVLFVITWVLIIGVALGVVSLIWWGWSWVLPQIWPDGPANVIRPNYWLFVVAWMLFGTIMNAIRGRI